MTDLVGLLTITSSGTPLEKEYREIATAMTRCKQTVHTFDPKPYDPRAVESARAMWLARMEFEHRSTAVFSNLVAQLMEANATLDAKVVMLRMAQDELRHTETCGRVVQALGGEPVCRVNLRVSPLATHRGCSPEERALRNVLYTTCLSEMVAVARFVDTLDTMTDPYLRDMTRLLLSDEILHGQFGFHYLQAWRPWLDAHPDVRASLERYLRHAFAVLEEALAGPPVSRSVRLTEDEIALGLPDPVRTRDVFYGTLEGAVVPGLENLGLDAGTAWRTRRKDPSAPPAPEPWPEG